MTNRAKFHHIVPKVLQRQFAIDGDPIRIWRAKRTNGVFGQIERRKIDKTLYKKDYYTVLENKQRSDRIERQYYGKVDDFLGRILPPVTKALNNGDIPEFSEDSLQSLRETVLYMAKRTPDFLPDHDDAKFGRELVLSTLRSLPKKAPAEMRRELEGYLLDDTLLQDQGRHVRVTGTIQNSAQVENALAEFVPRWAISLSKSSFILSSRMVYRIGNGGPNGLSNPNMEMWMPITPKIALVLVRDPSFIIEPLWSIAPSHIRQINEYAINNSFEVASHSEALLKSLLRQK